MEDNQTLLMMVLKQHFKDRPQILDEALCIIKKYSNQDSTVEQYEETIELLRLKMSDLPLNILLYFLNMIPSPKQSSNFKSPVIEEINTSDEKLDSIRSKLVEYLNNKIPIKSRGSKRQAPMRNLFNKNLEYSSPKFARPKVWQRRNIKFQQKDNKSLLDICARYVIKNQIYLKLYYTRKKETIWNMVNSNKYNQNELCFLYGALKDLNKKAKLIRMIDNEDTCQEVLAEEYGKSDIFLREKHLYHIVNEDPFVVIHDLKDAVIKFVHSYNRVLVF